MTIKVYIAGENSTTLSRHYIYDILRVVFSYAQMRTRNTVQKAEEFIEGEYEKGTEFCNYGLALSTFALHKTVASRSSTTRDRLVTDLRIRITTSKMCKLINR